ncbi:MAG: SDR family NAD(P)-dependent oxidoreductase [Gulosibacter sp.]|uniref:SDR family NAD(P)-dependent oxidoreductase n=1 Tax=Gulosibacter sp. TaxID=2817531 RepID=UPI003F8EF4E9
MTKQNQSQKVAVVTGAAQGIGAAVAEEFASRGHAIVIADINIESAQRTANTISSNQNVTALATPVDVSKPESIAVLASTALDEVGRVDALVNCAGITEDSATLEATTEDWDRVLRINLLGTLIACREFGTALIETQGAIVNISSIAAFAATRPENHIAYDASKSAIIGLTRTLGVEWAPHGVRVNAVAPGYSATPILEGVGAADPTTVDTWISQVPQRRLMKAAEIAKVVAFLASNDASAITGQTILADGGYSAAK